MEGVDFALKKILRDVSSMAAVLQEIGKCWNFFPKYPFSALSKTLSIGFEVDIHRNLTSQGMNLVKR